MIGLTVSHYRILEKLGGGRPWEVVYKSRGSAALGRYVSLKFLPEELSREPPRHRTISAGSTGPLLRSTILTSAQFMTWINSKGQSFIVMEFSRRADPQTPYYGEAHRPWSACRNMASRWRMPWKRPMPKPLFTATSSPRNIFLTDRGQVKLLDFWTGQNFCPSAKGTNRAKGGGVAANFGNTTQDAHLTSDGRGF